MRSFHSFFSTYLLPLILLIIPSSSLFFKTGSVLMVFLLIGSHRISLRPSQSMIPSLNFPLFSVVYPKVPYLAHTYSLSILLLLARWSQQIPSNTICTLMTLSCTSLSLLQILLYLLKHLPTLSLSFSPGWTWTNCFSIHKKWISSHWHKTTTSIIFWSNKLISQQWNHPSRSRSWLHLWLWHVFI